MAELKDAKGGVGNGGKAEPGCPCPPAWTPAVAGPLAWPAECAGDDIMFAGMLDNLLTYFSGSACTALGRLAPVLSLKGANLS